MQNIENILRNDSTIQEEDIKIVRNGIINMSILKKDWLGIYNGEVKASPLRTNKYNPYTYEYNIILIIQTAINRFDDAGLKKAHEKIDEIVDIVTSVLSAFENRTLNNTVSYLQDFQGFPFIEDSMKNGNDPYILSFKLNLKYIKQ